MEVSLFIDAKKECHAYVLTEKDTSLDESVELYTYTLSGEIEKIVYSHVLVRS